MFSKDELVEQTNLAFDLIQKLYLEVSYLIKEMEEMLNEEEEEFVIGKPSGYGITARGSTGLEASNVKLWLLRKFAVCFVTKADTEIKGGKQETKIHDKLKILYLRIVLQDEKVTEPTVYSGVLYGIRDKGKAEWITKFEKLMGHFEYNDDRVFKNPIRIEYEDAYIAIKGELIENKLFEITNSEAIRERIIKPSLNLYRKH